MADDSEWGNAWGSISDTVASWFDTPSENTSFGADNSVDNYSVNNVESFDTGNNFDILGNYAETDDSFWDPAWDTLGSVGSALGDFAQTKTGQTMIAQGVGMLGQYLMGDSKTGATAPKLTYGSSGGGGGGGGETEPAVQGRTTSNLNAKLAR